MSPVLLRRLILFVGVGHCLVSFLPAESLNTAPDIHAMVGVFFLLVYLFMSWGAKQ